MSAAASSSPWEAPADPAAGFAGVIGHTLADSRPWWRTPRQAPAGAPNIVVILLDDVGFSDLGCFGGEIATPHIDALAGQGLRFTGYTTVPMCTPARAALLTGKNPHAVGAGWLTHNHPGYPGYQAGEISRDAPTLPELLRAQGYSTYGVGKWHNTPDYQLSLSGDRASWPLQRGFDRFYGFLGAETNSFSPGHLIEGNEFQTVDAYPENYYTTRDWTDRSIQYLRAHQSGSIDKPFFLYLAHNAPHVPLQAPPQDIARYAQTYQDGWDTVRQRRYERQQAMGLIDPSWRLPLANPGVPRWADVPTEQRPMMAHYMQLYAAMIDVVDQNVGRLVTELKNLGVWDNTLIILTSDNGASSIGGADGASNIAEKRLGQGEPPGQALQAFRDGEMGTVDSAPAYPVGWGNCSNTPFRFYKRTPMNGGIRVPFILRDAKRVPDPGALRRQWIHVTDTTPMLLDLLGLDYPTRFNGHPTRGLDGVSYLTMLGQPGAPPVRSEQHYELEGNRGFIHHPWKIVSLQPPGSAIALDNWMLFNLSVDPTECDNLASSEPEVLASLVAEFERDAQTNRVYPLDNRDLRRVMAIPPFLVDQIGQPRHFYPGVETVPGHSFSALLADRDYRMVCDFDWQAGQEGVLFAIGDKAAGMTAFVRAGRLSLAFAGGRRVARQVQMVLYAGSQQLVIAHHALGGRRGQAEVSVNGLAHPEGLDMSPTFMRLGGEGLDVGLDRRRKVSADCEGAGAWPYAGMIRRLSIFPGNQAPDSTINRAEAQAQLD